VFSTTDKLGPSQTMRFEDFKSESNLLLLSEIAVIRINSLPRMLCMITSAALNKPGLMLTIPTPLPAFNSLRIFNSF